MQNRVREWRERMGLSQNQLAHIVGVASSNLCFVETGKMYAWPKLRRALCEVLDATEQDLFPTGETSEPRVT